MGGTPMGWGCCCCSSCCRSCRANGPSRWAAADVGPISSSGWVSTCCESHPTGLGLTCCLLVGGLRSICQPWMAPQQHLHCDHGWGRWVLQDQQLLRQLPRGGWRWACRRRDRRGGVMRGEVRSSWQKSSSSNPSLMSLGRDMEPGEVVR